MQLDALAINPFAHSAATVHTAEREYAFQHAAVASSLGLHSAEEGDKASLPAWREDVRQAVERELPLLCGGSAAKRAQARATLRLLLAGRFLPSSSSGVPSGRSLLRGLRTPESLSTVDPAFAELLRLVQAVLEVRKAELEVGDEPKLLDGTARSLLFAIEDYFAGVERLHSALLDPHASGRPEKRLAIFVGGEQQVVEATPEQAAVIRSPLVKPGLTRVTSGAGTGKTTVLLGFAQRLADAAPSFSPRVLVRARRLRDKLKPLFPGGGKGTDEACVTLNALVKRTLEQRHGERFRRKWLNGRTRHPKRFEHEEVMELLRRALDAYNNFLASTDPYPTANHVAFSRFRQPALDPNLLLPLVEELWARVSDLDDVDAPLTFGAQVKLCQLDETFEIPGKGPLLVDEVQDFTPCELDLLVRESSRRRVVIVGDPLQALDGYRGADNSWTRLEADTDLALVQTHRFGPDVAFVANAHLVSRDLFLGLFNLVTLPNAPEKVRILSSIYFDPKSIFRLCRHAHRLSRDLCTSPDHSDSYHYALGRFRTWSDFEEELESWGDDLPQGPHPKYQAWRFAMALKLEGMLARADFLGVLREMERRRVPDEHAADVTLTIAYQAKGLEFDHVVVPPSSCHLSRSLPLPDNSLHVAITRAVKSLEIPDERLPPFPLVNQYKSASLPLCKSCGIPSTSAINHHTPFPLHPSHLPCALPHHADLDAHLEAAKKHYAAVKPEHFPLCLDCAATSPFPSLKAAASFARSAGEVDEPVVTEEDGSWGLVPGSETDEATDEAAATRFDGFVEKAAARRKALLEAAKEEIEMKSF
ncbi:hypothetical protein JCM8097_004290 [Rhodosporidiobolus ruineniae]